MDRNRVRHGRVRRELTHPAVVRDRTASHVIHIASAQLLDGDLGQLVTYDDRILATARDLGITTVSPT